MNCSKVDKCGMFYHAVVKYSTPKKLIFFLLFHIVVVKFASDNKSRPSTAGEGDIEEEAKGMKYLVQFYFRYQTIEIKEEIINLLLHIPIHWVGGKFESPCLSIRSNSVATISALNE